MAGYVLARMFGLSAYKDKTSAWVLTIQESLYRVILVILTITAILWMSVFLYATFYYTYMPAKSHIRPLHFQFKSCGNSNGICSFPTAEVSLTKKQRLLMVGQPYKVVVELEMPESPANQNAGMFMVCGEITDEEYLNPQKSCRSAMLHYKSLIHRVISTLLYFPFLLSGSAEEKQLVSVELFSGFQDFPDAPATDAIVTIESQHLEIYQAYLKIHAHFTGLRYFMHHWPFLAALLGVSTNFFFVSIICFLSWYKFYVPNQVSMQVGYDGRVAESIDEHRKKTGKEQSIKDEKVIPDSDKDTTKDATEEDLKGSDEKSKLENLENDPASEEESESNSTEPDYKTKASTDEFEFVSDSSKGGSKTNNLSETDSTETMDGDQDKENIPDDAKAKKEEGIRHRKKIKEEIK